MGAKGKLLFKIGDCSGQPSPTPRLGDQSLTKGTVKYTHTVTRLQAGIYSKAFWDKCSFCHRYGKIWSINVFWGRWFGQGSSKSSWHCQFRSYFLPISSSSHVISHFEPVGLVVIVSILKPWREKTTPRSRVITYHFLCLQSFYKLNHSSRENLKREVRQSIVDLMLLSLKNFSSSLRWVWTCQYWGSSQAQQNAFASRTIV